MGLYWRNWREQKAETLADRDTAYNSEPAELSTGRDDDQIDLATNGYGLIFDPRLVPLKFA